MQIYGPDEMNTRIVRQEWGVDTDKRLRAGNFLSTRTGPEEKSYIFFAKKLGVPSGENHTSRGFPDWRSRLSAYHLSGVLWNHARGQHPSGPVDRITYIITRIGQGGIGWAFLTHVLFGGGKTRAARSETPLAWYRVHAKRVIGYLTSLQRASTEQRNRRYTS